MTRAPCCQSGQSLRPPIQDQGSFCINPRAVYICGFAPRSPSRSAALTHRLKSAEAPKAGQVKPLTSGAAEANWMRRAADFR